MTYEEEMESLMAEADAELEESSDERTAASNTSTDGTAEENENTLEESTEEPIEDENEEQSDESGDTEVEEEAADAEEEETTTSDFTPINIVVNGNDVAIESKEDMMAYIKAGADSFGNNAFKHTEETSIVEQGKLSSDDLKLLVEAKNGSKEAIAKLAENSNVDIDEIDSEMANDYKQQQEYYMATEVDKVADEISADPKRLATFQSVTANLPEEFMEKISSDATTLRNFSRHLDSGLAQEIIPKAITASMKYGGSFFDHYAQQGQMIVDAREANKKPKQRTVSTAEKKLRDRAAVSNTSKQTNTKISGADEIWNMSREDFAKIDLRSLED